MREIHVEEIRDNVAQICIDAAYNLSDDVLTAFDRAIETETAQLRNLGIDRSAVSGGAAPRS